MAALRLLVNRRLLKNVLLDKTNNINLNCIKGLNYFPKTYDGNVDPGPLFIKEEVQTLLKSLSRVDLNKVYRKRKTGEKLLEQPTYKFLTNEQLEEALLDAKKKVDNFLQIPPIVSAKTETEGRLISSDNALRGLDSSKFVFTDITYGLKDKERLIVVRHPNGDLREADLDVRHRMNQTYFPKPQRTIKMPKMFMDEHLESILDRKDYVFILDRACLQFEPYDFHFQRVVSIVYQHVNDNNAFELLRSTRHFGGLAFFLAWNKMIENLLLELIETLHINEAEDLIQLYGHCHNIQFKHEEPLQNVEQYIENYSIKKGSLELSIQSYKEIIKQKLELEKGIQMAHGKC